MSLIFLDIVYTNLNWHVIIIITNNTGLLYLYKIVV